MFHVINFQERPCRHAVTMCMHFNSVILCYSYSHTTGKAAVVPNFVYTLLK